MMSSMIREQQRNKFQQSLLDKQSNFLESKIDSQPFWLIYGKELRMQEIMKGFLILQSLQQVCVVKLVEEAVK
jgi:hypothetical protein